MSAARRRDKLRFVRFYTDKECEEWLSGRNRQKPDSVPQVHRLHFAYPRHHAKLFWVAHWIASTLTHRSSALLWITEWGIWESTENSHLYYKLRQSFGDQRLLWEAPGHLFLGFKQEDLTSFLHVAMLNGWGGYLLTQLDYVNLFFSHDEYIDFFAEDESNLGPVREELIAKER